MAPGPSAPAIGRRRCVRSRCALQRTLVMDMPKVVLDGEVDERQGQAERRRRNDPVHT
jgi:hypothetical protein